MKNKQIQSPVVLFLSFLGDIAKTFTQKTSNNVINLQNEFKNNHLAVVNRVVEVSKDKNYYAIKVNEDRGEGFVWLNDTFSEGIIEVNIKGEDSFQKSFVGIAFHGQSDTEFDAVYFRPYNFHAQEIVRRIRAVQYISLPKFTWKKLRETRSGQFEKVIKNAPNPNGWFKAKLEITAHDVKVYINASAVPVLSVKKLSGIADGKIGLFVGDSSGGEFANLKILKKK